MSSTDQGGGERRSVMEVVSMGLGTSCLATAFLLSRSKGENEWRINVTSKTSRAANVINRAAVGRSRANSKRTTSLVKPASNRKSWIKNSATLRNRARNPVPAHRAPKFLACGKVLLQPRPRGRVDCISFVRPTQTFGSTRIGLYCRPILSPDFYLIKEL